MRTGFGCLALALAIAGGCYTGPRIDPSSSEPSTSVASTTPASAPAPGEGDLPCDVAALLAEACSSCHGEPLSGGAKNRLLYPSDFEAPSKLDPSKTVGDDAVARMKDAANPMPPTGLLSAARVAVLENWIAAGMPKGACDAGAAASSTPTPYDTPTVCTSNQKWTRGDHGSSSMHPGVACIDCHQKEREAPLYRAAGTVYPTAHEPDDCYGTSASITVEITDANGSTYKLPVNSAGNFYSTSRIAVPYRAKLISGSKSRAMVAAQTNGDCNSCHTERGTEDAPGRIMAP